MLELPTSQPLDQCFPTKTSAISTEVEGSQILKSNIRSILRWIDSCMLKGPEMSQKGVVPKSIQILHITLAININRLLLQASTGKVLVSRANFSRRLKTSCSSPATWPKVTCGVKEGEEKCVLLGGRKAGAFEFICIDANDWSQESFGILDLLFIPTS